MTRSDHRSSGDSNRSRGCATEPFAATDQWLVPASAISDLSPDHRVWNEPSASMRL